MITRASRVCCGGSIKRCNKKVFYLRCAVENTTRSPALSASERKLLKDERVLGLDERENRKYYGTGKTRIKTKADG
jgi:hypothetical protein